MAHAKAVHTTRREVNGQHRGSHPMHTRVSEIRIHLDERAALAQRWEAITTAVYVGAPTPRLPPPHSLGRTSTRALAPCVPVLSSHMRILCSIVRQVPL